MLTSDEEVIFPSACDLSGSNPECGTVADMFFLCRFCVTKFAS